MKYELFETRKLLALEKVFPNHLLNLSQMIRNSGYITTPLIATQDEFIVLDGSHRHVFFLQDGCKLSPVTFVDYNSDDIRVGTHLMHRHIIEGDKGISKQEVIRRGLTGDLYPPRTTRHFFPFRKSDTLEIKLSDLGSEEKTDVRSHIYECDIQEEIVHNLHYIKEIDEELDEIIRYLWEIRQTKKYLLKQVELMNHEK
jgi:hypothetical protein